MVFHVIVLSLLLLTVTSVKHSRIPLSPISVKKDVINTISFFTIVSGGLFPQVVLGNDINFMEKYPYSKPSDILHYIYDTAEEGNVNSVLTAMDKFSRVYPMYKLSPEKVNFLNNAIATTKSQKILELGTFFGYSALNIAKSMTKTSFLTTVEGNSLNFEVANVILDYALKFDPELRKRIKIVPMNSDKYLESLTSTNAYDFVYLDHDKNCYLHDIEYLLNNNLVGNVATVVADNIIFPGSPGYLEYMESKFGIDNTKIKYFPFERVGFETNFKEVKDGMSITRIQINA